MARCVKVFEVPVNVDDTGEAEELSWDLFPLVDPRETIHLGEYGLPKIGALVMPGMILVGKIGKSRSYSAFRKPTCLEIHTLGFEELKHQFGHGWVDTSLRAPADCYGVVVESRIDVSETGQHIAVVHIEVKGDRASIENLS